MSDDQKETPKNYVIRIPVMGFAHWYNSEKFTTNQDEATRFTKRKALQMAIYLRDLNAPDAIAERA